MSLFKNKKCKICKTNTGTRFCLRKGFDICWEDCNSLRVDENCPTECEYHLQNVEIMRLKGKTDSQTEYIDLLKKQMAVWINKPQKIFNDQIPLTMVETKAGKKRITEFFNQYKINPVVPLYYLKERLSLHDLKVNSNYINYEDIANEMIGLLYANEWHKFAENMIEYDYWSSHELIDEFITMISKNKVIKKISDYQLISSAATKEKDEALIHYDINNKYDMTISLKLMNKVWKVKSLIIGKPELVNGESEAIQQVAILLSKNETSKVRELLTQYGNIYITSSDFAYYWGLYYTFLQDQKRAEQFFLKAMILDKNFVEAKYNYAFIQHSKGNTKTAKMLYEEVLEVSQNEPKTLNNLASLFIDEKDYDAAQRLLERCIEHNSDFELAKQNLDRLEKLMNNDL